MSGKSGHWGNPFTKENANAMRLRGLETRRFRAEKRLIEALCSCEATEPVRQTQLAGPGPSQPKSDASKPGPAVEIKTVHTRAAPLPNLQPGEEIRYGYQIAPEVWIDAKPPAPQPNGLIAAAVLRAQRMYPRHWSGKRPSNGPR
jgi:hypothetical protein